MKREICSASSSEDSSSSKMEMFPVSDSSTLPDSSCGNTNENMTSVTQLSESGVQSDTCSISMDTINETKSEIDEDEELTSSHDPLIDEENHPSVDRSKEDLIKEEIVPLLKNVHGNVTLLFYFLYH